MPSSQDPQIILSQQVGSVDLSSDLSLDLIDSVVSQQLSQVAPCAAGDVLSSVVSRVR